MKTILTPTFPRPVLHMQHCLKLAILYGLVTVLSACELSTPEKPIVTTSIVNSFGVVGNTVDQDERIVLPLLPSNAEVSGNFDLLWDVISSDPYTIEVYISSNSILDPTDTQFLQTQCGINSSRYVCEQIGDIPCAIAYEPLYQMVQDVDENGDPIFDENNEPVMVRAKDDVTGYFIVLEDHYYLRCADGPATVRIAEITDRIELNGFPFINYFIFKACATDELICPEVSIAVQFLDSQP
ncbi:hypothetical protein [Kaarinaea lacus]